MSLAALRLLAVPFVLSSSTRLASGVVLTALIWTYAQNRFMRSSNKKVKENFCILRDIL